MVHPGGFEPPTARFVAEYSIQLSYGCKMAVRRGFEPRMQLLTAYSLSRGAPSASRPPHHTPLTSASKSLFRLIVAAWRTYYFLGLISQTIFPDSASFAHLPPNQPALPTKRLFNQHKCAGMTINRSWSKRGKARREKQKKAYEGQKIQKGMRLASVSETRQLSNWTVAIFQPGYAGRSLHGVQIPLWGR